MEILKKYPGIRLATAKDSERLQEFFATSPMDTSSFQLTYKREPDFFKFLSYQTDEPFIFCAENEKGELTGVASLNVREGYVHGKLKRIGYMADLRSRRDLQSKDFTKVWKQCLGDVIGHVKTIPELRCDYLITVIMAENKKAKRSLVNREENLFHYEKLCTYKMVNIVTCYKKLKVKSDFKVEVCTSRDEIVNYIGKHQEKRPFGYAKAYIHRAFDKWDNLTEKSFLKVTNSKNEIMGMCAVWNPSPVKTIMIEKLPRSLKLLSFLLSPFTKMPKEKRELKVQYLNFMAWDDERFFPVLVNYLSKQGIFKEFDTLSYADYDMFSLKHLLKGAIIDETPIELYQVVSKKHMDELMPIKSMPGFEMALV